MKAFYYEGLIEEMMDSKAILAIHIAGEFGFLSTLPDFPFFPTLNFFIIARGIDVQDTSVCLGK